MEIGGPHLITMHILRPHVRLALQVVEGFVQCMCTVKSEFILFRIRFNPKLENFDQMVFVGLYFERAARFATTLLIKCLYYGIIIYILGK